MRLIGKWSHLIIDVVMIIALTAGPEEFTRGTVKVKDLFAQAETEVALDQVTARVKDMLTSKAH